MQRASVAFVIPHAAVTRISEPNRAIAFVYDGVVRGIERFSVKTRCENGFGPVVFVAHNAPVFVLAGNLATLIVERVAVAVPAGFAEEGHAVIVLDPAHLQVVGNVTKNEVAPDAIPGAAFGPERVGVGVQSLNGRIAEFVFVEPRVQRDKVGVRVTRWVFAAPIAGSRSGQAGSGDNRSGEKVSSIDVFLFHFLNGFEVRAPSLGQPVGARKSSRLAKVFRWMLAVHE